MSTTLNWTCDACGNTEPARPNPFGGPAVQPAGWYTIAGPGGIELGALQQYHPITGGERHACSPACVAAIAAKQVAE